MWRELDGLISAVIVLPLVGSLVILIGGTLWQVFDDRETPNWQKYLMSLIVGAVVFYLPRRL